MSFIKPVTVSPSQRKSPIKARAPFASILKSFSSGAEYECATKVHFLSSVIGFPELSHIHTTESEMDLNFQSIRLQFSHQQGRMQGGLGWNSPLELGIFQKLYYLRKRD